MSKITKNAVISVSNLSKYFTLYKNPRIDMMLENLLFIKSNSKKICVLDNISFNLKKGEVLGIIGMNGSGKSTLLRILVGSLLATKGNFVIKGDTVSLLDVSFASDGHYTGKETINYIMSLYGLSKDYVEKKINEIINFSEINEYINQPIRTYSTGMKARLLFSVIIHLKGDVFLIDEAFNGGDIYFIQKAKKKIKELCTSGSTIVYISHNTSEITELCDKVLVLNSGKQMFLGDTYEGIKVYNKLIFTRQGEINKNISTSKALDDLKIGGNNSITFTKISLLDKSNSLSFKFYYGEKIKVKILYESIFTQPKDLYLFVGIDTYKKKDFIGELFLKEINKDSNLKVLKQGIIVVEIPFNPLLNNNYSFWISIRDDKNTILCEYRDLAPFFSSRKKYSDQVDSITGIPAKII